MDEERGGNRAKGKGKRDWKKILHCTATATLLDNAAAQTAQHIAKRWIPPITSTRTYRVLEEAKQNLSGLAARQVGASRVGLFTF